MLESSLHAHKDARKNAWTEFVTRARLGVLFTADVLCMVRLSRKLYPQHAQHNLDSLIARHGLNAPGRHRALGDARMAWQFMQTAAREHSAEDVMAATKSLLKMPSLPPQLDPGVLDALPVGRGVYVFYGVSDLPIYIGKSVNLRDRVRSHFSSDHRHSNDVRLSMEIRRIEFEETAGELGALLRESQLIKSSQPLRNLRLRRNAQLVLIKLTNLNVPVEIIKLEETDARSNEPAVFTESEESVRQSISAVLLPRGFASLQATSHATIPALDIGTFMGRQYTICTYSLPTPPTPAHASGPVLRRTRKPHPASAPLSRRNHALPRGASTPRHLPRLR